MSHIFLSYARRDGLPYVERLEKDLNAADYSTWRDKRNLNPYQDFSTEIERAIKSASLVVVLVTPEVNLRDDSFVRREVIYALWKKKPIVQLLLPHTDPLIQIIHLTLIEFRNEHQELDY